MSTGGRGTTGAGVVGIVGAGVRAQPQGIVNAGRNGQTLGEMNPRSPARCKMRQVVSGWSGMVLIRALIVTRNPGVPQTLHAANPGLGGNGGSAGAAPGGAGSGAGVGCGSDVIVGAGVGIGVGRGVAGVGWDGGIGNVGAGVSPQPHGPVNAGKNGQTLGSMKPRRPARCKIRQVVSGVSGIVVIKALTVTRNPGTPQMLHTAKPGLGGSGGRTG